LDSFRGNKFVIEQLACVDRVALDERSSASDAREMNDGCRGVEDGNFCPDSVTIRGLFAELTRPAADTASEWLVASKVCTPPRGSPILMLTAQYVWLAVSPLHTVKTLCEPHEMNPRAGSFANLLVEIV